MRTRLLGIVVAVALVVSCAGIRPVGAADTVPFVNVSIVDGYVGEYEEYHVRFLLSRDMKLQETLSIVFDDNINRAGSRDITDGDLSIDGVFAGASAVWSGHTLTVPVPVTLAAGIVHELVVLRGAMIQNPWTSMHIQLFLRDDIAGTTLASNYYGIGTVSRVSPVSLTIETPGANHLTVLLRFRTGRNGAACRNTGSAFPDLVYWYFGHHLRQAVPRPLPRLGPEWVSCRLVQHAWNDSAASPPAVDIVV